MFHRYYVSCSDRQPKSDIFSKSTSINSNQFTFVSLQSKKTLHQLWTSDRPQTVRTVCICCETYNLPHHKIQDSVHAVQNFDRPLTSSQREAGECFSINNKSQENSLIVSNSVDPVYSFYPVRIHCAILHLHFYLKRLTAHSRYQQLCIHKLSNHCTELLQYSN